MLTRSVLVTVVYLMQHILVESVIMDEVQARWLAFWPPQFVVGFPSVTGEATVLVAQHPILLFQLETHPGGSGCSMLTQLGQQWFSTTWPQLQPRNGHATQAWSTRVLLQGSAEAGRKDSSLISCEAIRMFAWSC